MSITADTYDAKVNRNVNVSGIDSVNLVVKDEKENLSPVRLDNGDKS